MTPEEQDKRPDAETFRPLRHATSTGRAFALLAGPIIWVVALAILATVASESSAVGLGLLLFLGSLALGFILLIPQRRMRMRRERENG